MKSFCKKITLKVLNHIDFIQKLTIQLIAKILDFITEEQIEIADKFWTYHYDAFSKKGCNCR
jgi:hypothetical protein